jgi:hypothetical protein
MSDQDELLKLLEAHGEQFLQSFHLPISGASAKRKMSKSATPSSPKRPKLSENVYTSDEEWTGIRIDVSDSQGEETGSIADSLSDEESGELSYTDVGLRLR